MLGLTFSSNLDWGSYIIAIVKTTSKKIGALIRSMKFLSPEVAFYLYKSGLVPLVATWNCGISYKNNMQGCWSFTCCLSRTLGSSLKCSQLESSVGITFVDVYLNQLKWFHFLILKGGIFIILIDCMTFLSPFLNVTRMSMSTVSFFAQLGSEILCLQNAFL